jgi:hypothetical protein
VCLGNREGVRKYSLVMLSLFGKPAWELDGLEGEELGEDFAGELEKLGEELRSRLRDCARILRLLVGKGWSANGGLYDIDFTKDVPKRVAVKELKELGLDLEVEEEEYEEEEEDEGEARS